MKILITGACGYVGSEIAHRFREASASNRVFGIDNLSRRGSESNWRRLEKLGVQLFHGDVRVSADLQSMLAADWVIDCAANPSILAGTASNSACGPEQLVQHNLAGTLNILEYCRRQSAGLVLLSTSRVYSIESLRSIPLREMSTRFDLPKHIPRQLPGFSAHGVNEDFPTSAPISLYGATKLASEIMSQEYAQTFGFPLWINRCSVIGGPGQFGKADQGIFSYWVYACLKNQPVKYTSFNGRGKQVRDCVLAQDVADLVYRQVQSPNRSTQRVFNIGGGRSGAVSLLELTRFCERFMGKSMKVTKSSKNRPFDIPYFVTDTQHAREVWNWKPSATAEQIIENLCHWASQNADWVRSLS
jgi:CDP-paratose 2-epimerase